MKIIAIVFVLLLLSVAAMRFDFPKCAHGVQIGHQLFAGCVPPSGHVLSTDADGHFVFE